MAPADGAEDSPSSHEETFMRSLMAVFATTAAVAFIARGSGEESGSRPSVPTRPRRASSARPGSSWCRRRFRERRADGAKSAFSHAAVAAEDREADVVSCSRSRRRRERSATWCALGSRAVAPDRQRERGWSSTRRRPAGTAPRRSREPLGRSSPVVRSTDGCTQGAVRGGAGGGAASAARPRARRRRPRPALR